jgi:hypothetical protein
MASEGDEGDTALYGVASGAVRRELLQSFRGLWKMYRRLPAHRECRGLRGWPSGQSAVVMDIQDPLSRFAVALGVGLLIGLKRGWRRARTPPAAAPPRSGR